MLSFVGLQLYREMVYLLITLYASYHHEHIIEHHHLLRVVNEGEVIPVDPVVEEIVPQPEAGTYFFPGFSEAPDSTPSDQGKPRCI